MTGRVTVVVLNRDRIDELRLTLAALTQQSCRDFEVVIVSNQPEVVVREIPQSHMAHIVRFDEPNVAAARNVGISESLGDIIAFCDDDAVPEPKWLERLLGGFTVPDIGGVGGLVRGRNGVSVQWGPQEVDCFGNDWPHDGTINPLRTLKTVGTNCAFRREALQDVGGFDPFYRFFLDETDLDWRMARNGWKLRFCAAAEVHHGYSRSALRTAARVPLSLYDIGLSKARFCARFGDDGRIASEIEGFVAAQRKRLIKLMLSGVIEPTAISQLMQTIVRGLHDGADDTPPKQVRFERPNRNFRSFVIGPEPEDVLVVSGWFKRRAGRREAHRLAKQGMRVTFFEVHPSSLMLRVWFDPGGYWTHRGGLFGRRERAESVVSLRRRGAWIRHEKNRIGLQRCV